MLFPLSAILKMVEDPSLDINATLNGEGHLPISFNVRQDVVPSGSMVAWKIQFCSMFFYNKMPDSDRFMADSPAMFAYGRLNHPQ